jgi:hypothetical protein
VANFYITEFNRLLTDSEGKTVMAPHYPPVAAEQQIVIGAMSVQSVAFSGVTRFLQISTDSDVNIAIGANPTASAATGAMYAKETRFVGVERGHLIAVATKS